MNDPDIIVGNAVDLEVFKAHFRPHDKNTLEGYYRIARKKGAMLVVRKPVTRAPQMQVMVVPYKFAELDGGLRKALRRGSRFTGYIQGIRADAKKLFVFGEGLPKNDGDGFKIVNKKKEKEHEATGSSEMV